MKILTSASRLVFIAISLTVCTAYLVGIFRGTIQFETKDFLPLASMAFGYYFGSRKEKEEIKS